eukprot:scaffold2363_cov159-Pinguiococcus_pyrenoidosus.AAC.8
MGNTSCSAAESGRLGERQRLLNNNPNIDATRFHGAISRDDGAGKDVEAVVERETTYQTKDDEGSADPRRAVAQPVALVSEDRASARCGRFSACIRNLWHCVGRMFCCEKCACDCYKWNGGRQSLCCVYLAAILGILSFGGVKDVSPGGKLPYIVSVVLALLTPVFILLANFTTNTIDRLEQPVSKYAVPGWSPMYLAADWDVKDLWNALSTAIGVGSGGSSRDSSVDLEAKLVLCVLVDVVTALKHGNFGDEGKPEETTEGARANDDHRAGEEKGTTAPVQEGSETNETGDQSMDEAEVSIPKERKALLTPQLSENKRTTAPVQEGFTVGETGAWFLFNQLTDEAEVTVIHEQKRKVILKLQLPENKATAVVWNSQIMKDQSTKEQVLDGLCSLCTKKIDLARHRHLKVEVATRFRYQCVAGFLSLRRVRKHTSRGFLFLSENNTTTRVHSAEECNTYPNIAFGGFLCMAGKLSNTTRVLAGDSPTAQILECASSKLLEEYSKYSYDAQLELNYLKQVSNTKCNGSLGALYLNEAPGGWEGGQTVSVSEAHKIKKDQTTADNRKFWGANVYEVEKGKFADTWFRPIKRICPRMVSGALTTGLLEKMYMRPLELHVAQVLLLCVMALALPADFGGNARTVVSAVVTAAALKLKSILFATLSGVCLYWYDISLLTSLGDRREAFLLFLLSSCITTQNSMWRIFMTANVAMVPDLTMALSLRWGLTLALGKCILMWWGGAESLLGPTTSAENWENSCVPVSGELRKKYTLAPVMLADGTEELFHYQYDTAVPYELMVLMVEIEPEKLVWAGHNEVKIGTPFSLNAPSSNQGRT